MGVPTMQSTPAAAAGTKKGCAEDGCGSIIEGLGFRVVQQKPGHLLPVRQGPDKLCLALSAVVEAKYKQSWLARAVVQGMRNRAVWFLPTPEGHSEEGLQTAEQQPLEAALPAGPWRSTFPGALFFTFLWARTKPRPVTHPAHGRAHRGSCSNRKAAAPGGSSAGRPLDVQASWRFFWFLLAGTMNQGINKSCTCQRGTRRRLFRSQSGSPWRLLCQQAPGGPLLLGFLLDSWVSSIF